MGGNTTARSAAAKHGTYRLCIGYRCVLGRLNAVLNFIKPAKYGPLPSSLPLHEYDDDDEQDKCMAWSDARPSVPEFITNSQETAPKYH